MLKFFKRLFGGYVYDGKTADLSTRPSPVQHQLLTLAQRGSLTTDDKFRRGTLNLLIKRQWVYVDGKQIKITPAGALALDRKVRNSHGIVKVHAVATP